MTRFHYATQSSRWQTVRKSEEMDMRAIDAVFRWPRSYLEELIPDLELGSSLGGFVRPAGPMFGARQKRVTRTSAVHPRT